MLDPQITSFLDTHRVCCLATMISGHIPHSSVVYYSFKSSPLQFFFSVLGNSRKCRAISVEKKVKASLAIGFNEEEWLTMQLSGDVVLVEKAAEIESIQNIHYNKHPELQARYDVSDTVFLKFIPNWWRFTDFNTEPPTITMH